MKRQFCQSCGMPTDMDKKNGGTNVDGSKNKKYCSYCYRKGEFVDGITDLKEYKKFVRAKRIENGVSPVMASLYNIGISRLERWKKS